MIGIVAELLISGLLWGGIYAIIAIGLNLVYSMMKILNLAYGDLLVIGAYVTFWLFALYGINPLASIPIVVLVSLIIGIILYLTIIKPILVKSKTPEMVEESSIIVTIGLSLFLTNLSLALWKADPRIIMFLTAPVRVLGVNIPMNQLVILALTTASVVFFHIFITKTISGKAMQAIIQDPQSAELIGINLSRMNFICFCLGMLLTGFAGSLVPMVRVITPFSGIEYTLVALSIMIIGGVGNLIGSLIGGFLVGIAESLEQYFFLVEYRAIVPYIILILVLLIRPKGLLVRR